MRFLQTHTLKEVIHDCEVASELQYFGYITLLSKFQRYYVMQGTKVDFSKHEVHPYLTKYSVRLSYYL